MDSLEELHILLDQVKECNKCRANSTIRWYFKPKQLPKIMLISETPGPYPLDPTLDGIPPRTAQEPRKRWFWELVEYLFGNRFRPRGDDKTRSTVYWTHYQKCSKKISTKINGYFGADCANRYLDCEIKLVDPKLIIAFGMKAGELLVESYHLTPLGSVDCRIGRKQTLVHVRPGAFQIKDEREYAVLCHPSAARYYGGCTVFQNEYEELKEKTKDAINRFMPSLAVSGDLDPQELSS
jgi:uracil-DNA glycosylase